MIAKTRFKYYKPKAGTTKVAELEVISTMLKVTFSSFSDIFFKGDVVEILNAPVTKNGEKQYKNINIGDRYKVIDTFPHVYTHGYLRRVDETDMTDANKNRSYNMAAELQDASMGYGGLYMSKSQIMLYRRPLKNWLKYFSLILTKRYRK